eukprot:7296610-Pyramimonas_sp.AAC.1
MVDEQNSTHGTPEQSCLCCILFLSGASYRGASKRGRRKLWSAECALPRGGAGDALESEVAP